MGPTAAIATAITIVAVVLIAAAYLWYNYTGWQPFSFASKVPFRPGDPCTSVKPADSCPEGEKCCGSGFACVDIAPDVKGYCAKRCSSTSDCSATATCEATPQDGVSVCVDTADEPYWGAGESDISRLRFKDCVFTVVDPAGRTHVQDVTAVLNSMTAAYMDSPSAPPKVLHLDRPLNPFSFTIPGVNDVAAVPTAADAARWADSPATLTGKSRVV